MKKYLLTLILGAMVLMPGLVLAQNTPPNCTPNYAGSKLCNALPSFGSKTITNITDLIVAVMVWGGSILLTVAFFLILYAGLRMIIAQGDQKIITESKATLFYAIIGVAVSIFSYVIVSSIEFFLGVKAGQPDNSFFYNPLKSQNLAAFINQVVSSFLVVAGSIAVLYIVIGGFRYLSAGGNEEQVKKARGTITWAIGGLILIILSYTIIEVLRRTLAP